jgi:biotin carboxylase
LLIFFNSFVAIFLVTVYNTGMLFVVGKISPDFRAYFAKRQLSYGLFAPLGNRPSHSPVVYEVDYASPESILASLQALHLREKVTGVLTTGYEHFVVPAAIIAEYFAVPGMSLEAAQAATDKVVMRQKFATFDPAITPEFSRVETWEDAVRFMSSHSFPVMLKPTNLMKSLYVTKNNSMEQLQENYERTLAALPQLYERFHLPALQSIVEECMVGSMHTVAGFVGPDGEIELLDDVVDCQTAQDIGRADNYLFSRSLPSQLDKASAESVKETARKGVAALGLRNTPIHAELMLTERGPKIIEIGARMGGYRPRMLELAKGVDMYGAAVHTAQGESPALDSSREKACTVLEIFSETMGPFGDVPQLAAVQQLPSYQYVRVQAKPGALTGKAADGFRAPLVVILAHNETVQVAEDVRWILDHVTIELQAA